MDSTGVTVAIGTNSRYKVNAVKKVFYELDLDYKFVNSAAKSGVSDQPRTTGETKLGSINRAKHVLELCHEADIGIGVEFGYEPDGEGHKMLCWATIADKEGNIYSEQSSTLTLPKMFRKALDENTEVNDVVWDFINSLEESDVKRSVARFVLKNRVIYECVENVVIRYVIRELF